MTTSTNTHRRRRSNEEWLTELQADGRQRDEAISALNDYLLRAILVYLTRRRSDLAIFDYDELHQFAQDWAQQGVIQVLDKLETFRGESSFTTWAYRIGINLAAGELRRKRWENLSLERLTEAEAPVISLKEDLSAPQPEDVVARSEVWQTVQQIIDEDLTERQRTALTKAVLQGIPIEIVADQMDTNRNNIYKIVHDARKKLKRGLESRGWTADEVMRAFQRVESDA